VERPPNCEALVTPWAECSSQCGLGLSRRMSNANEACKPNNETRLCQIRPCHSPPLVNAKYARHHHIRVSIISYYFTIRLSQCNNMNINNNVKLIVFMVKSK